MQLDSLPVAHLFTDGSCLGNPGPGGWAYYLKFEQCEILNSGGERETTNNRMELSAVVCGLREIKEASVVHITTDSQYVMKAFTCHWLQNWQKNQWKTSQKKPVKNQDLWKKLLDVARIHSIRWSWIRGHTGHPENEKVDKLAREAAVISKCK